MDYYRKALRGQPRSIPLRHDLARLCLKLGRFEDASAVLRQVYTTGDCWLEMPSSDRILTFRGIGLGVENKLTAAIQHCFGECSIKYPQPQPTRQKLSTLVN